MVCTRGLRQSVGTEGYKRTELRFRALLRAKKRVMRRWRLRGQSLRAAVVTTYNEERRGNFYSSIVVSWCLP
jgi:hypothetical protein